jgi:hypothetical protein
MQSKTRSLESIDTLKTQISESRVERNMKGREEMLQQLAALQEEEKKLDAEVTHPMSTYIHTYIHTEDTLASILIYLCC